MVDEKKCLHQKIAKLEVSFLGKNNDNNPPPQSLTIQLQLESNPCQGDKLEKIIQTDPQHEVSTNSI